MESSRIHYVHEEAAVAGSSSSSAAKAELEQARAQVAAAVERYRSSGSVDTTAAQMLSSGVVAAIDVLRARDATSDHDLQKHEVMAGQIDPELAVDALQLLQSCFDGLVPTLLEGVFAQRPVSQDVDRMLKAMLYLDRLATHQEQSEAV